MSADRPRATAKIPNLYELLKLAPLESNDGDIRAALRQLAERIKQMKSPDAAMQATKLFQYAKVQLLEPSKKAAYDSAWQKVYGSNGSEPSTEPAPPNSKEAAEPGWDLTELTSLLPTDDPAAPLDLAAFLESSDVNVAGLRSVEDLDRDFQRLFQLLGGQVDAAQMTPAGTGAAVPIDQVDSGEPVITATAVGSPLVATATPVAAVAVKGFAVPGSSRQLRKKRDRSLILMIGGALALMLAVLGGMAVVLKMKQSARQIPELAMGTPAETPVDAKPVAAEPQGSGLPQPGSGLPQPGSGLPQPGETVSGEMPPTASPDVSATSMVMNTAPMTAEPAAAPVPENTPEPTPQPTTPTTVDPPTMAENPPPAMESPEPVALTDKEKRQWKRSMLDIKQLLTARKFDKAHEALSQVQSEAKSPEQQAQLARLVTIESLVKEFDDAVHAAGEKLTKDGGGATFTAGSQEIAFVEATPEVFKVKIQFTVQRYSWEAIPIVLGNGLADLVLDQSPRSAAVKAAAAAVHPKLNKSAKESAREQMQAAAAADAVPADTHEFFDDTFDLP